MRTLMLKLEPVIWGLFGAGMMVGALLFPAFLLVVGLAGPLGVLSDGALAHERLHALFGNPLVRLVGVVGIALPLWAGAHHLRHLAIDFGGIGRDALVGSFCYAIALAGTVLAVIAVTRL